MISRINVFSTFVCLTILTIGQSEFFKDRRGAKSADHGCNHFATTSARLGVSTAAIGQSSATTLRSLVITRLICVAYALRTLHNFDGMLSLVVALQSSSIARLKVSWAGVPDSVKVMFDELCNGICSPSKNWKNLRSQANKIYGVSQLCSELRRGGLRGASINYRDVDLHKSNGGDGQYHEVDGRLRLTSPFLYPIMLIINDLTFNDEIPDKVVPPRLAHHLQNEAAPSESNGPYDMSHTVAAGEWDSRRAAMVTTAPYLINVHKHMNAARVIRQFLTMCQNHDRRLRVLSTHPTEPAWPQGAEKCLLRKATYVEWYGGDGYWWHTQSPDCQEERRPETKELPQRFLAPPLPRGETSNSSFSSSSDTSKSGHYVRSLLSAGGLQSRPPFQQPAGTSTLGGTANNNAPKPLTNTYVTLKQHLERPTAQWFQFDETLYVCSALLVLPGECWRCCVDRVHSVHDSPARPDSKPIKVPPSLRSPVVDTLAGLVDEEAGGNRSSCPDPVQSDTVQSDNATGTVDLRYGGLEGLTVETLWQLSKAIEPKYGH
jgi:hypothetical protein